MVVRPLLLLRRVDQRQELLLQAETVDRLRVLLLPVGMVDQRRELLPQVGTVYPAETRPQRLLLLLLEVVPRLPLPLVEVLLLPLRPVLPGTDSKRCSRTDSGFPW